MVFLLLPSQGGGREISFLSLKSSLLPFFITIFISVTIVIMIVDFFVIVVVTVLAGFVDNADSAAWPLP